jgi:hypothetical protein
MGNVDTIGLIAEKIEALAEATLSERGVYLLSELGKDLGPDLRTLKLVTKQSLSAFIQDRFSDKYLIAETGEFNNIKVLIRSHTSTVEPEPLAASDHVIAELKVVAKSTPRFNYRFWAAFSVPLGEGRRFLDLSTFTFEDVAYEADADGRVEIPSTLIAAPDIPDRDQQITANILHWIEQHGLKQADFYQSNFQKRAVQSQNAGTVLEAMIAALDHKQLLSTTLSLDVVATLMRKKV